MKFEDILLSLLIEQPIPPEEDDEIQPDDENPEDGDDAPDEDEPLEPADDEDMGDETRPKQALPAKPKPLKPMEVVINRWMEESHGLDEAEIRNAIDFFKVRRDSLKPYVDPEQARIQNYRNSPEVVELKRNFPTFPAENGVRLKDIQNYTWVQLEFLIDRFNGNIARELIDFRIEGDTPELREQSALSKWTRQSNRIVNKNGVIVYRVTSQDESIALGNIQHILTSRYGGNPWCITSIGSTMYNSYRNRRAYYFIMDTNKPEDSEYRVSVIQPIDHNIKDSWDREGPFVISVCPNYGDRIKKTWEDIVSIWPELDGESEKFRFFGRTAKEIDGVQIGQINFRGNPAENPWDFEGRDVTTDLKFRFINNPNNIIPSLHYFESLSDRLLHAYIQNLNLDTYHLKFVSNDPRSPYGILDYIQKSRPTEYKFLNNEVLKNQLGLTLGVGGLKVKMMKLSYDPSFIDLSKNIKQLVDKNTGKYGIVSTDSLDFIKVMGYMYTSSKMLVKMERDENGKTNRIVLNMYRYVLSAELGGDDYYYWLVPYINILPTSKHKPNYYKGTFYDSSEGDQILNSGEYMKI